MAAETPEAVNLVANTAGGCGETAGTGWARARDGIVGTDLDEKRPKPIRDYLTVSEVATLFHVSTKTVVRWANDGRLPYMSTLGGHRRFPRAEIEQLLAGQQHVPIDRDSTN